MNVQWIGSPNYWAGRSQKLNTIVMHWMAGNMAAADKVFNSNVGTDAATSAHYGIEDNNIHQYVRDEDTAWHARQANPFSIGIEHSAQPGRDASPTTLETSANLIASIAKKNGLTISQDRTVPHSLYVATTCPGTLPLNAIIKRAQEVSGQPITIIDKPSLPQPEANKVTGGTLSLPAGATSWRVYKPGGPYTVGNEIGYLNPSLFGGLTYNILGNPTANIYLIQTRDFGQVAIYAGAETGASVAATNQGITMGSGGGKTVYLPAVPTWRVYKPGGPYTVGNEIGYLAPANYGGLAYAVLSNPAPAVAVINTQTFGQVAIYIGPETGAVVK